MNESNRHIFSGMQILLEKQWMKGQAVIVEDRFIKAIIPENMIAHHLPASRYEYTEDHYLIPGLIDLHIHGAHGKDVMDGSEEALSVISRALAQEGITGFLATTMTAEKAHLEKVLKTIARMLPNSEGAAILGVHLEGPFIAKTKRGAQADYVELPNNALMKNWQKIANGTIKVVTLAPELPGAIPLIQLLCDMKVIASIGHTNATYAETCAAITAGCTQATHLFNAMSGLHHREVGAATAILLTHNVFAEIIVDGLHLHPAIVELVLRLKGKEHLLLVTDAMRAKCLSDGEYDFGGRKVTVLEDKVFLPEGVLAGSTLRMPLAIKNMTAFSKCSLIDAIEMASYNPAYVLGLDRSKGTISVGKDADLVVANSHLDIMLTMREGKEIFKA